VNEEGEGQVETLRLKGYKQDVPLFELAGDIGSDRSACVPPATGSWMTTSGVNFSCKTRVNLLNQRIWRELNLMVLICVMIILIINPQEKTF
jgi:hypothetical protein